MTYFNPTTLVAMFLIFTVDFTCKNGVVARSKIVDRQSTRRFSSVKIYRTSGVSWHNPEVDPRSSMTDHSTSHFSHERTKGTPSGGGDGVCLRTIWLGYLYQRRSHRNFSCPTKGGITILHDLDQPLKGSIKSYRWWFWDADICWREYEDRLPNATTRVDDSFTRKAWLADNIYIKNIKWWIHRLILIYFQ